MNNDSSHSSILKLSMGSVTSNPMSDKDLFLKENKKFYKIITVFMIIDFILNELIILNDNIVLYFMTSGNKELKIFFFYSFYYNIDDYIRLNIIFVIIKEINNK